MANAEILLSNDPEMPPALSVQWCGINFSVGDKKILDNVSGELQPGKLTCILGPSGAGKSTLLNVLAGRQRTSGNGFNLAGTIEIGNDTVTPAELKKKVAFVMQDDSLLPTQTVEESLTFSSALKLPHLTPQDRAANVDKLVHNLGLDRCKDTIIGSALVKGISGGERKRTSVGVELITNPNIVLLDEPTSGLDSYAASELIKELKNLARKGCIVACTIHQPSSEVFELFDHVMCLRKGEMFYQGPNKELMAVLQRSSLPCPQGYNVADWLLMVAQTKTNEECEAVSRECRSIATRANSSFIELERRISIGGGGSFHGPPAAAEIPRAGFGAQVMLLTQREFRNVKRDKKSFGARMGMTFGQAILYALIFPGVASGGDVTVGNAFTKNLNVFGALVGLCIAGFFGAAQPLVLAFPLERPVFLREYSSNMYSVLTYFLAKTIVETIVVFLQMVILFLITFFIMGFTTGFTGFVSSILSVWLMASAAASMALWIGCSVSSPTSAIQLMPALAVPQILFSGLFIQSADLPVYLQWIQYICALKYGLNLLCIIEFGGDRLGGQMLLDKQNINKDQAWLYILILVGIFIGFRIVALLTLRKKGQYVF